MNLVPLPEVSALLRAGKLGRAVEAGGELGARVARVVGMADRGLVEASPLGLRQGAKSLSSALDAAAGRTGDEALFDVFLRDEVNS